MTAVNPESKHSDPREPRIDRRAYILVLFTALTLLLLAGANRDIMLSLIPGLHFFVSEIDPELTGWQEQYDLVDSQSPVQEQFDLIAIPTIGVDNLAVTPPPFIETGPSPADLPDISSYVTLNPADNPFWDETQDPSFAMNARGENPLQGLWDDAVSNYFEPFSHVPPELSERFFEADITHRQAPFNPEVDDAAAGHELNQAIIDIIEHLAALTAVNPEENWRVTQQFYGEVREKTHMILVLDYLRWLSETDLVLEEFSPDQFADDPEYVSPYDEYLADLNLLFDSSLDTFDADAYYDYFTGFINRYHPDYPYWPPSPSSLTPDIIPALPYA